MVKKIVSALILASFIAVAAMVFLERLRQTEEKNLSMVNQEAKITPISHATFVMEWGGTIFYVDPVGSATAFLRQSQPDIVLITDVHSDHFDAETLGDVVLDKTAIFAPPAVAEAFPEKLKKNLTVLKNGEVATRGEFKIEAVPMYNLTEGRLQFHPKGRGNGYIVQRNNFRVYIAGDTEDIPEMRGLKDIDIAFVPMNLPFTMTVEQAADAVLAFKPKKVYPYHYRGLDGLSNVNKFKELVNAGNPNIEVVLIDWYK